MSSAADCAGDDDVVLTGLSGRFPESRSVEEFAEQLFAGVDLVTADDRRWAPGLHGLPERCGKLKDLTHFNATFFGVHAKQANLMDPQLRILLELTHEVIVDAGFNPAALRTSRTGVYVGLSGSESWGMWSKDVDKISGYAWTGCSSSMFANRISYSFDFKGPSVTIDTACSSSMHALAQATSAIRTGQCDAAVVAGSHLCLDPVSALKYHRLTMLSPEGRCASFDVSGNGYARAEAIVVVLLQRKPNARRLYCTVRGVGTNNDGYKSQGITYPDGTMQRRLAEEVFEKARLRPQDVVYVEAHGTGTKVGDPEEVNAIAEFFCKDRQTPLLLGSVKSNMGHSEPAAGLCSIAKLVIAMERGMIPGNLHFKKPFSSIPALSDGRIKVVDANTPWQGGLVAVNSFGFGGSNAHVILESHCGPRPLPVDYPLPRLVLASGRTDEAVERLLTLATKHQRDAELHTVIDAVHEQGIPGHPYRGYILLDPAEGEQPMMEVLKIDEIQPVWFVFSGMGSQWAGMARSLLSLPTFAASIERSAAALQPFDVDLQHLITEAPSTAFDDIINSLVSIVAVQVALVDVLRELNLHPDGMIGHSIGEVGCAYADATFTAEQAVLSAYWRGRCMLDAKPVAGAMAAVGLSWEETMRRCPADIEIACHNSVDNVTISGPLSSVEKFATELSEDGVFVRRVNSAGLAFHSSYIAASAPALHSHLLEIIPEPKPRSERWVSSSLPPDQWNSDLAKLSDAAYHVNNLVAPVRFASVLARVPPDAVVVEVAPHGLLQAILRRALPNARHVPLLSRVASDPLKHLLTAVGKLYTAGLQPQVAKLYPPVSWPVSRGTPTLASHIGWDHSVAWDVPVFESSSAGDHVVEVDLNKNKDAFIAGHNINGRIIFPATGYLMLIWRMVAKMNRQKMEDMAIILENIEFRNATIVTSEVPLRLTARLLEGTGRFEICEGGAVVVTGTARRVDNSTRNIPSALPDEEADGQEGFMPLNSDDVYKELRLRGYHYKGVFCGIQSSDARGTRGLLKWEDNWISFMDSLFQFSIMGIDTQDVYLPRSVQRVVIDPLAHFKAGASAIGASVPVRCNRNINVIDSGGVEFQGVVTSLAANVTRIETKPKLEKYVFIPFDCANNRSEANKCDKILALTSVIQLAVENCGVKRVKVLELALQRPVEQLVLPHAIQLLQTEPAVRVSATLLVGADARQYTAVLEPLGVKVSMSNYTDVEGKALEADYHMVLGANVLPRREALVALAKASASNGYILLEEPTGAVNEPEARTLLEAEGLRLVTRAIATSTRDYVLLQRARPVPTSKVIIEARDDEYTWVEELKKAMKRAESENLRVYVWSRAIDSGVLGLGTCLRCEAGGGQLRLYYIPGADVFDPDATSYKAQVQRDLAFNVLRDGVWGTLRHMPLDDTVDTQQVEHAHINMVKPGDLSSLRWVESNVRHVVVASHRPNTELCRVCYASVNDRDVMLATDKLPPNELSGDFTKQKHYLGSEFSGYSSTGKRVMGAVASMGLATTVLVDKSFLWEVPELWSLEEAASVPVAYATAYYALIVRGRLQPGEAVLIHEGASGVGQAAIAIALHEACFVYTTVATPDQRAFLHKRFPELPNANIGNSCDCSFEQLVLYHTKGRGVDVVLNSLEVNKLRASLRSLATGGRFLEIGELKLTGDAAPIVGLPLKNTTIHDVQLGVLLETGSDNPHKAEVARRVAEGIAVGVVRPLPAIIYAEDQLEQAFRLVATNENIGKVVIRIQEEKGHKHTLTRLIPAVPRNYMHPAKSYVLVGGLGGFGLELGKWLVTRGARTLVLSSRRGMRTGYQAWCIRRWRERGVRVLVSTAAVTTEGGARLLLQEAAALAPVGGIFNLAGILQNALLENLTAQQFCEVTEPKINATRALDVASRDLAPELEHFVAFSSVVSGRGIEGASNYGLANSAMERLCEQRRVDELPALAIQWGPIDDVGMFLDWHATETCGAVPQPIASCLETLDMLLKSQHAVVSSTVLADKRQVQDKLSHLVDIVANILGSKNFDKLPNTATLAELGMDSLMSSEIKLTLERSYDLILSHQEIRELTIENVRAIGDEAEVK